MATKKHVKRESDLASFWTLRWADIDKSIENLRKDMEKDFSSFTSITMPKMSETSCDVLMKVTSSV